MWDVSWEAVSKHDMREVGGGFQNIMWDVDRDVVLEYKLSEAGAGFQHTQCGTWIGI